VLQDQVGDVGIVAGQDELSPHAGYALYRPHQHFQHVDVVDADLQHHAAGHADRLIAPGAQIDLAEPIAADVALGLYELAEAAGIDLGFDPAEMTLAPALVAERKHDAGILAYARDLLAFMHRVGDRFVRA